MWKCCVVVRLGVLWRIFILFYFFSWIKQLFKNCEHNKTWQYMMVKLYTSKGECMQSRLSTAIDITTIDWKMENWSIIVSCQGIRSNLFCIDLSSVDFIYLDVSWNRVIVGEFDPDYLVVGNATFQAQTEYFQLLCDNL